MIRCLHCNAETSNGLALCDLCQRRARDCLEFLPVYFRNLARQRRPGRPNGSLGGNGQWLIQRGEVDGSRVQLALGRTMNDVTTWARTLADDRDLELPDAATEAQTVAVLCALLDTHLASIGTLEWAGQFVRDIARQERALRELTETVVPGWYAGRCRQITGRDMEGEVYRCDTAVYVVPGLTWVTCSGCHVTTAARDHLEAILEEARVWVAPPMRIAEALVALLDTEMSVPRLYERIKKWGTRERIPAHRRLDHDGDLIGPRRYAFGDALDALLGEGPTSASDTPGRQPVTRVTRVG